MKGRKPKNPDGRVQVATYLEPEYYQFVRQVAEHEGLNIWRVVSDAVTLYREHKEAGEARVTGQSSNDRPRLPLAS